jgi:hypothetical protein
MEDLADANEECEDLAAGRFVFGLSFCYRELCFGFGVSNEIFLLLIYGY